MKRDLTTLLDLTNEEVLGLLKLAGTLKKKKGQRSNELKGKSVGLLFQKPSNRTRVSFEVAIWQLGGNCIYLSPAEINLGKRESVGDVARTLSRYLDALVARTNTHADLLELSHEASIPVINGLSDLYHPCQALADILSIKEVFGFKTTVAVSYVGDGNNVCHSLMIGCAKVGFDVRIATPKGYEPDPEVLKKTLALAKQTKCEISVGNSPEQAVKNADVIYSDVWVSMGQEDERQKRQSDFAGFQINGDLVKLAKKNFIFLHCLPAHRGEEVTADVIDGTHSVVFDQAENRLHAQKAALIFLLKNKTRRSI
jgi:ornithine carbamoyltransferase